MTALFPVGTLVRRERCLAGYDPSLVGIVGVVLEDDGDGSPLCAWRQGSTHFHEYYDRDELSVITDEEPTESDLRELAQHRER